MFITPDAVPHKIDRISYIYEGISFFHNVFGEIFICHSGSDTVRLIKQQERWFMECE